jgi:hypothetical protein
VSFADAVALAVQRRGEERRDERRDERRVVVFEAAMLIWQEQREPPDGVCKRELWAADSVKRTL